MNKLMAMLVGSAMTLSAALAFADVSGPQAKSHITDRLQYSTKVPDKSKPFRTELGGKKGDKVRPFTASNIRAKTFPGGFTLHVGNRVSGTLNTKTGAVRTTNVIMPR